MFLQSCLLVLFAVYPLIECNELRSAINSKTLARLPRSNSKSNNEEFEKFFLKASKSVPRIGRRGFTNENAGYYGNKFQFIKTPSLVTNPGKRAINKNLGAPFWADIARIYEYNAELPNILENLANMEQAQGDDPSVYDFDKLRTKKTTIPHYEYTSKEYPEYRLQPEI